MPNANRWFVAPFLVLLGACSSSSAAGGPSDDSVCSAVKSYLAACPQPGLSAACTQADISQVTSSCSTYAGSLSVAYKNAVTTCAPSSTCPYGDPFLTSCFANAIEGAPQTAAQTKLASDYCGGCAALDGQTLATCTSGFWGLNLDAATQSGPGSPFLSYSETILEQIDAKCAPQHGDAGAAACLSFLTCGEEIVAGALPAPPAACLPASLDAGSADGG